MPATTERGRSVLGESYDVSFSIFTANVST